MLTIVVCAGLVFGGCGDDDSTGETTDATAGVAEQARESPKAGSATTAPDTSKEPTVDAPDGPPPVGLVENDLVKGSGPTAEVGDRVTIHYVGAAYETGEKFDSSWKDEPFAFRLGSKVLLPGGEQGIKGMRAGGRRELIIPPDLAFGKEGITSSVAPEETVIFVVDLLKVE